MDFYLSDSEGKRLHFPVNPERITAATAARMQTFEVIELGEVKLPQGQTPVRFSWEGFFPGEGRQSLALVKSWRDPKEIAGDLSVWRDAGTRLRLMVTETPINHDVYIESFEHTWGGGHGDAQYQIELVQARELVVRTDGDKSKGATVMILSASASSTRPKPAPSKTYTVKSGDTFWGIAKKTLGDGSRWREIYEISENTKLVGPDPNLIKPGQVLRLPV